MGLHASWLNLDDLLPKGLVAYRSLLLDPLLPVVRKALEVSSKTVGPTYATLMKESSYGDHGTIQVMDLLGRYWLCAWHREHFIHPSSPLSKHCDRSNPRRPPGAILGENRLS